MTIRAALDCALRRADMMPARLMSMSADAGVTPTTMRVT